MRLIFVRYLSDHVRLIFVRYLSDHVRLIFVRYLSDHVRLIFVRYLSDHVRLIFVRDLSDHVRLIFVRYLSDHVRLISVTPSSSDGISMGVCSTARRPVPALTSCRNYRAHLQLSIQDVLATHGKGGGTVSALLLL